ncbi:MAG: translation initiation factor IF-2 [Acidobacteriota bacterium]|nr:MAG: translation initiation factor IF-2 [Acidobacteriota bacterium]
MGKVRIYDLAKELKLESKKVIEDARRMGIDVSVPSNSLDDNIAAKIREMYYPKKEQAAAPRTARLIKHHPTAAEEHHDGEAAKPEPARVAPAETAPVEVKAKPVEKAEPKTKLRKLTAPAAVKPEVEAAEPAPAVEVPAEVQPAVEVPVEVEPVAPVAAEAEPASVQPAEAAPPAEAPIPEKAAPATGTKVIKLATPTRPLPKPAPPAARKPVGKPVTGKQQPEAARDQREKEVHLLPSGAQQRTVYIPPRDSRPKGRHQQRRDREKDKEAVQKVLPRRQAAVAPVAAKAIPRELKPMSMVEGSTVREFAESIDAKPRDIVTQLMQRGVMATINQTINADMAIEIGKEYGYNITIGEFEDLTVESEFEITPEAMEDTDPRAPVVTVMGHVDHGKTSLLDAIRESRVAEGEAGGITQHIGAYSVEVPNPDKPSELRRVVFLDTPGHEAFTMMRARGAKVTDLVVLVVAADDGVMPQTIEAIEHAKAAEVPIVVAINKIDKPDANAERVKKELADRGLLWDGWGGDTTMVEVSAKKHLNIDGLLEMILLTADILDLKANPKRKATGTVLEAKLDRGRGAVATVLVQNGTLRIGEPFIIGNYFGKVRALMDDRGERVQASGPATPVEVLGLEGVPAAGDQLLVVSDVAKAQQIAQFRQTKARVTALARSAARGLDQLAQQMESGEVKELLVILKADVQGSVEVLKDTLHKLSTEKVKVRIIRSGVGAITESDVLLASASNATSASAATVIIGFNVRPEARADEIARQEEVDVRLHSVIYKVEEEIRNAMLGLLEATLKEVVLGKAEVRDVIRVPKVGSVAGCMVLNGSIKRNAHARLIRDNVVIYESHIGSLRRFKDDVSEVQQGFECGITVERFNDYKTGDIIEAYVTEKVAPTRLD